MANQRKKKRENLQIIIYLVIRVVFCHTGLDVTHEGVDEAGAFPHCLPIHAFGAAQVPVNISIIYFNPHGNTNIAKLDQGD